MQTQNEKWEVCQRVVRREWPRWCHVPMARLASGFAIDVRSLAVFRMAMASMGLVDLAERAGDLTAHYTDAGVLPRAACVALQTNGSTRAGSWAWSLHLATGTTAGEAVLFLAAAWFAIWMLVGYRTRLATAACWLFVVSIYYRNPMLEDAGDTILRTVLFWSMFAPLGAAASVDRRLKSAAAPLPRQIISLPGAALLLQICMIYWATAAEKHSPVWLSEHTAIYYTLSLDAFATPFGQRLLAWPRLLEWLTASVYWLEWLGPAIAILPLRHGLPRLLVVAAFWGLHLGTALTLGLGALPWVSMAIWTVFLPGALWDRLGWHWPDAPSRSEGRRFAVVAVAMLAIYTMVWNINEVTGAFERRLPPRWKVPAYVLGLEQTWRMFAPFPLTDDGWYEMRGTLADGSVVNLWEPDQPLASRKPAHVAATYHNRRWRKYLIELRFRWAAFVPEFVDWLAERWNREYAGDAPQRRLKHVAIIYHIEQTLSPDRASSLIVPEIVFEGDRP